MSCVSGMKACRFLVFLSRKTKLKIKTAVPVARGKVTNNWGGFKIQRYNPPYWRKKKRKEWGQWDRVSWHCQSSAWQKTCRETMAGILSRRLKVSVLHTSQCECSEFDWWVVRLSTFLGLHSGGFGLFTPVDEVQYNQICWMIFTSGLHHHLANNLV